MTTPSYSRSSNRSAAARIAPALRPVTREDFFPWVSLLAESLEVSGLVYRDEIALRIWQQLGLDSSKTTPVSQLEAIVADRSGNLIGLALMLPSISLSTGAAALDVHLAYVHRAARDEAAARALVAAVQQRARAIGATKIRWLAASDTLHQLAGAEPISKSGIYESDPALDVEA